MGTISKWSASLVAHINSMIQKVENHEALADVTIQDMQRAAARAKAHLSRVARETVRLEQKLVALKTEVERWEGRAVECAEKDRDRARACLGRKRECERQLVQLRARHEEQLAAQVTLDNDIAHITRKIEDFKRKRQILQTRQSRAEAVSAVHTAEDCTGESLDDVFERWEFNIIEREAIHGLGNNKKDPLDEAFLKEEEDLAIDEELDVLCNKLCNKN